MAEGEDPAEGVRRIATRRSTLLYEHPHRRDNFGVAGVPERGTPAEAPAAVLAARRWRRHAALPNGSG